MCNRLPEVLRVEDDWMNLLTRDTSAGNLGQTEEDESRQIPFLNTEGNKLPQRRSTGGFQSGFDTLYIVKKRLAISRPQSGCH